MVNRQGPSETPMFTPKERQMNERTPTQTKAPPREAPLFASPWLALFLLLRKEWSAPRAR